MNVKNIQSILNDMEINNKKLYDHIEMVSMLSYAFSQELNLSYKNREMSYICGLIHEFAKFYIEKNNEIFDKKLNKVIFESIFHNNLEFKDTLLILNDLAINDIENDNDKVKLVVMLSDEYDNLRRQNLKHEETCKVIREKYSNYNNMVTVFLKSIIKNQLNYEYKNNLM